MFLKTMNLICNPVKDINYLQLYINTVRTISLKITVKTKLIFQLLMALMVYKFVHFLILGLVSKHFTDYQRTIHFDALYLLVPKYRFNLFASLATVCMIIYIYVLFERPNKEMNDLLWNILIEGHTKKNYFIYQKYNKQNVVQCIKRFSLKILHIFSSLILVIGKN